MTGAWVAASVVLSIVLAGLLLPGPSLAAAAARPSHGDGSPTTAGPLPLLDARHAGAGPDHAVNGSSANRAWSIYLETGSRDRLAPNERVRSRDATNLTVDRTNATQRNVAGQPLVAKAKGASSAPCGTPVGFNGTASGGIAPYTWSWAFGDGATAALENPLHAYAAGGSYLVTLQVKDQADDLANSTLTVNVSTGSNCLTPLTVNASATPAAGSAPLTAALVSRPSGGVPIYTFAWAFGDGSARSTTQNTTHTYARPGSYTARVWVNDTNGDSANATATVQVGAPQPLSVKASMLVLDLSCVCGTCKGHPGMNVSLAASITGGVPPFTALWSFGDGTPDATGENVTHAYVGQDPWNAVVTVTDALGARAVANVTVTAQGLAFNCPEIPAPAPIFPTLVVLAILGGATLMAAVLLSLLLSRRKRRRSPTGTPMSPEPADGAEHPSAPEGGAQVQPDGEPEGGLRT